MVLRLGQASQHRGIGAKDKVGGRGGGGGGDGQEEEGGEQERSEEERVWEDGMVRKTREMQT